MKFFCVYISIGLTSIRKSKIIITMTVKKANKVKIDGEQLRVARRYETAWHKLFYECGRWKQTIIIEEPHGRHADELVRESIALAERGFYPDFDPQLEIPVSGEAEEYLEVSGKHY